MNLPDLPELLVEITDYHYVDGTWHLILDKEKKATNG